jgi:hypothetical protein
MHVLAISIIFFTIIPPKINNIYICSNWLTFLFQNVERKERNANYTKKEKDMFYCTERNRIL